MYLVTIAVTARRHRQALLLDIQLAFSRAVAPFFRLLVPFHTPYHLICRARIRTTVSVFLIPKYCNKAVERGPCKRDAVHKLGHIPPPHGFLMEIRILSVGYAGKMACRIQYTVLVPKAFSAGFSNVEWRWGDRAILCMPL